MKIYFKVQAIGSPNGYNNTKFLYHDFVQIWPKWDDERNDEKSVIVSMVHPDLVGTLAFNQNFAKMNKGDDSFDMRKYKEVPNMEARIQRDEIFTIDYNPNFFDKIYCNQLRI